MGTPSEVVPKGMFPRSSIAWARFRRTEPPTQVSQPADHVLAFGHLHYTATDVNIRRFDRLANLVDGHVVGEQAIRVDLHLVLFHIATNRGDFGDSVDRHQVVTEIPVLE